MRAGFTQRIDRFARAALRALDDTTAVEEMRSLGERVAGHAESTRAPGRAGLVTTTAALVRWLHGAKTEPSSLADAVTGYLDGGAWVDRARTLLRRGDAVPSLNEACERTIERATAAREIENRRFAQLLASATSSGARDERLVFVEDVIDRVVAPLAAKQPALLLVLDGMSAAVCHALLDDILDGGWCEIVAAGTSRRHVALAALPSITEVSRTSLLAGKLCAGGSSDERAAFAGHASLLAISRAAAPPAIFHKADLADAGAGLADDVRRAIESSSQQVVAVVVNAIDDHLTKGDQVPVQWSMSTIRPLALLLDAARRAGRVVVMTSDHGHVEETGLELRRAEGGSARHRPAQGRAGDDEVLLEGPRVGATPARAIIALATERVRYGAKQNGYHGGATPQEMVVPLVLLAPSTSEIPTGWIEWHARPPSWWEPTETLATESPPTSATTPQPIVLPSVPARGQGLLFTPPPERGPAWLAALLASTTYQAQRRRNERMALSDDHVRAVLGALDGRGGKMTRAALARAVDLPLVRLASVLSALRRLLNIEGYAVLDVDEASETVSLDRALLATQFELKYL